MTADPIAVYCGCPDPSGPGLDSPDFIWNVGLLYPHGTCYLVGLNPQDLSLAYISPLEDNALAWNRPWTGLKAFD